MTDFTGFEEPQENWSKLPHQLIEHLPSISTIGEMKVVLYILRHTWGYHDGNKRITFDEFQHGRKRKDGTRLDNGTGLSKPTIIAGIGSALTHKFINVEVDNRDLGRVKKLYSINNQGLKNFTPGMNKPLPRTEKDTLEKETLSSAPQSARDETPSSTSIAHEDNGSSAEIKLTCEGCWRLSDTGVCSLSSSLNPESPLNKIRTRCELYKAGDAIKRESPGVLDDHNSAESNARRPALIPDDKLPPPPLPERIAATIDKATTIKTDPATLNKRDWSVLGQALYFKHGRNVNHLHALPAEIESMDKLTQDGILRALKRHGQYALTDDGREWVDAHIDQYGKEYRESGIKRQETWEADKRSKNARKEQRRRAPAQPKGRKKINPDTQPIVDRLIAHWGKADTKEAHNNYVTLAQSFHNANGTPDEVDEIVAYYKSNEWNIGINGRILVNGALGTVRKERQDIQEATASAPQMYVDNGEPLDASAGIAYFANEE